MSSSAPRHGRFAPRSAQAAHVPSSNPGSQHDPFAAATHARSHQVHPAARSAYALSSSPTGGAHVATSPLASSADAPRRSRLIIASAASTSTFSSPAGCTSSSASSTHGPSFTPSQFPIHTRTERSAAAGTTTAAAAAASSAVAPTTSSSSSTTAVAQLSAMCLAFTTHCQHTNMHSSNSLPTLPAHSSAPSAGFLQRERRVDGPLNFSKDLLEASADACTRPGIAGHEKELEDVFLPLPQAPSRYQQGFSTPLQVGSPRSGSAPRTFLSTAMPGAMRGAPAPSQQQEQQEHKHQRQLEFKFASPSSDRLFAPSSPSALSYHSLNESDLSSYLLRMDSIAEEVGKMVPATPDSGVSVSLNSTMGLADSSVDGDSVMGSPRSTQRMGSSKSKSDMEVFHGITKKARNGATCNSDSMFRSSRESLFSADSALEMAASAIKPLPSRPQSAPMSIRIINGTVYRDCSSRASLNSACSDGPSSPILRSTEMFSSFKRLPGKSCI